MADPPVRPGDILARKYRVDRVLGAGAMGVVVAATHVELGQVVAVKHLLTGKAVSIEQRERFLREARAAVLLKSHHVARVLDVGTDEQDAPYIVMEYLEGQDLAALLKNRNQLSLGEAVEYVLQACEAIGEAHASGIVHRDLKPANMFLTEDVGGAPIVKLLDFGISKLLGQDVALTHESQMLGSPLYMSPEQMTTPTGVDARSDIWALGIILYQLVAGRTPFHAATIQGVCALVIGGQPTPLSSYRPDLPPAFEAVILRCLARNREQRFRDVAELAVALAPFAPERARVYVERVTRVVSSRGPRLGSSAEISSSFAPSTTIATQPLPMTQAAMSPPAMSPSLSTDAVSASVRRRRSSSWPLVAVGVVAGVLVFLLIGALIMNQPSNNPAIAASPSSTQSPQVLASSAPPNVEPVPSSVVPVETAAAAPSTNAPAKVTAKPAASSTPAKAPGKTKTKDITLYEP